MRVTYQPVVGTPTATEALRLDLWVKRFGTLMWYSSRGIPMHTVKMTKRSEISSQPRLG